MKEITRLKALNALRNAKPKVGGDFFPQVYVVADEIFFTENAAKRAYVISANTGRLSDIEVVKVEELFELTGANYEEVKHLITNHSTRGDLYHDKLFNSKIPKRFL